MTGNMFYSVLIQSYMLKADDGDGTKTKCLNYDTKTRNGL